MATPMNTLPRARAQIMAEPVRAMRALEAMINAGLAVTLEEGDVPGLVGCIAESEDRDGDTWAYEAQCFYAASAILATHAALVTAGELPPLGEDAA